VSVTVNCDVIWKLGHDCENVFTPPTRLDKTGQSPVYWKLLKTVKNYWKLSPTLFTSPTPTRQNSFVESEWVVWNGFYRHSDSSQRTSLNSASCIRSLRDASRAVSSFDSTAAAREVNISANDRPYKCKCNY